MSTVALQLQQAHGYVPLLIVGYSFVEMWAGIRVGQARKAYNVPYPQMYAEKDHKYYNKFNCILRAEQNLSEKMPMTVALQVTSSILRPEIAAICGVIRLAAFVAYVQGYSTGDPSKRLRGAFGYIGTLGMLFLSIEAGVRMLGWL